MWTARILLFGALACTALAGSLPKGIVCDADSDCFYVPPRIAKSGGRVPALVVLHCNGAVPKDLGTFRLVADSLGWIEATCHAARNHRGTDSNDVDVVRTIRKLLARYPVDSSRLFLFGFSGQGVQALATLLLHPELVRGVVAVCPQLGGSVACGLGRAARARHLSRNAEAGLEPRR